MKQLTALVLVMSLVLCLLVGCTPENQSGSAPTTTAGQAESTGQTEQTQPTEQTELPTEDAGIELPDDAL